MPKFRGILNLFDALRWCLRFPHFDGSGDRDPAGSTANLGSGSSGTLGGSAVPEADVLPATGHPSQREPGFDLNAGSVSGDPAPAQRQAPADPNQRANANPAQPQTAAQWQSIRDAVQAYGHQFGPEVTDDRALVQLLQLAQRNRQSDFYARLGQQIAPHVSQFQQYMQGTHPAAAAVAPAAKPTWEAPVFDERWGGLVEHDPASGVYVSKAGVPPEIAQKVNAYVDWKLGFDRNPAAVINGMVEERARKIATETFQTRCAAQQRETTVNQIIQTNTPWLDQFNPDDSPVINPVSGQPAYTPAGARYVQQLQALRSAGVSDPVQQESMAKQVRAGAVGFRPHSGPHTPSSSRLRTRRHSVRRTSRT